MYGMSVRALTSTFVVHSRCSALVPLKASNNKKASRLDHALARESREGFRLRAESDRSGNYDSPASEEKHYAWGGSGATYRRRTGGDWANLGEGGEGADLLVKMGQSDDANLNANGQSSQHIDFLFAGNVLGATSDIFDGSLRSDETMSLAHLRGDYHIAPKFLEAIGMHIAKNILCDQGALDARVPLILGIWGGKGQGKSFQTELAFKKLGVAPIIMSAGELEHELAGTPGKLIRERYRKAASIMKNEGKLSCLMINDLDAGIGRFGDTQCTVNNQIAFGTLMNLCDHPNSVSIGNDWVEDEVLPRVPIIVTGNDFSRLYAPLIRDGRMEKFYWSPTDEDLTNILYAMYKDDGLTMDDMAALLREFPGQTLDFFGAVRASLYDSHIRHWIFSEVFKGRGMNQWTEEQIRDLRRRLLNGENLPMVENVVVTMDMVVSEARRLSLEQEQVMGNKLSEEYMKDLKKEKEMAEELKELMKNPPPPPPPPPPESAKIDTSWIIKEQLERQRADGTLEYMSVARPELLPEEEEEEEEEDWPWLRVKPEAAMDLITGDEQFALVDIRPAKDFDRDSFKKAVNVPAVKVVGFGENAVVEPLGDFLAQITEKFPGNNANILLCGGKDGEFTQEAMPQLLEAGYENVVEVKGGYSEWSKVFRPNGEPRPPPGYIFRAPPGHQVFKPGVVTVSSS